MFLGRFRYEAFHVLTDYIHTIVLNLYAFEIKSGYELLTLNFSLIDEYHTCSICKDKIRIGYWDERDVVQTAVIEKPCDSRKSGENIDPFGGPCAVRENLSNPG